MAFLTRSKTGAEPYIAQVLPTLYLWTSPLLAIYILVLSLYIPYLGHSSNHFFSPSATITILVIHFILFIMLIWSYFRVRLTNPGYLPRPHKLTPKELHTLEAGDFSIIPPLPKDMGEFILSNKNGLVKYCETCQIHRPARASHCREKGRCVAKFDHHCPVLSSAIGLGNYKYYIQFLWYTALLAVYLQVLSVLVLVQVGKSGMLIFLSVLAGIIAVGGVIPLFCLHVYLISNGYTTKEKGVDSKAQRGCAQPRSRKFLQVAVDVREYYVEKGLVPAGGYCRVVLDLDLDSKPWDHGLWKNWSSVMGVNWWEWILPVPRKNKETPKGDWGAEFSESTKEHLRRRAREFVEETVYRWRGEMEDISCQNQGYPGVGEATEKFVPPSIAKPNKAFLAQ